MFDVGFAEILLLSLVGLLVLGPERLPRVARTLGNLSRKARSSWLNLKRSIEAEIQAEEFKQPIQQFRDEVDSTVKDMREGMNAIHEFDPLNPEGAGPAKSGADKPDPGNSEPTEPSEKDKSDDG